MTFHKHNLKLIHSNKTHQKLKLINDRSRPNQLIDVWFMKFDLGIIVFPIFNFWMTFVEQKRTLFRPLWWISLFKCLRTNQISNSSTFETNRKPIYREYHEKSNSVRKRRKSSYEELQTVPNEMTNNLFEIKYEKIKHFKKSREKWKLLKINKYRSPKMRLKFKCHLLLKNMTRILKSFVKSESLKAGRGGWQLNFKIFGAKFEFLRYLM